LRILLLIGTAGAFGAVSRYAVGVASVRLLGPRFAFGTLLVNVLGCLLLGVLLEFDRHTGSVSHPWRMLVAVGFLGAFTTFSTFGYETFRYVAEGSSHLALLNPPRMSEDFAQDARREVAVQAVLAGSCGPHPVHFVLATVVAHGAGRIVFLELTDAAHGVHAAGQQGDQLPIQKVDLPAEGVHGGHGRFLSWAAAAMGPHAKNPSGVPDGPCVESGSGSSDQSGPSRPPPDSAPPSGPP